LQGLERATPAQLEAVEIVGAQSGLHWPHLNVDHYAGIDRGIFGNKRWMSEIGKRGENGGSSGKRRQRRATAQEKNGGLTSHFETGF
jgi:hypothetical protein